MDLAVDVPEVMSQKRSYHMGLKDGTLIRSSPSLAMGVACHIDVPPIPTV